MFSLFLVSSIRLGEVLKRIFFRNTGIAKVLAVERDVEPRNMKFAKLQKRGGGVAINREGAFIRINTVSITLRN